MDEDDILSGLKWLSVVLKAILDSFRKKNKTCITWMFIWREALRGPSALAAAYLLQLIIIDHDEQ